MSLVQQQRSNSTMQQLTEVVASTKAAVAVSVTTTGLGVSTFIDLIPDNIGKLASLVGIILSVVLIGVHVHAAYIRHKEHERKD